MARAQHSTSNTSNRGTLDCTYMYVCVTTVRLAEIIIFIDASSFSSHLMYLVYIIATVFKYTLPLHYCIDILYHVYKLETLKTSISNQNIVLLFLYVCHCKTLLKEVCFKHYRTTKTSTYLF